MFTPRILINILDTFKYIYYTNTYILYTYIFLQIYININPRTYITLLDINIFTPRTTIYYILIFFYKYI